LRHSCPDGRRWLWACCGRILPSSGPGSCSHGPGSPGADTHPALALCSQLGVTIALLGALLLAGFVVQLLVARRQAKAPAVELAVQPVGGSAQVTVAGAAGHKEAAKEVEVQEA
jgi:hypothetical protein